MAKIFIDAEGAIFGRLCSFAAKKALEENEVIIINSEKSIITGNRNNVIKEYSSVSKKGRSHSLKGPKYSKVPYKMLKRAIRGMLPDHRKGIGKKALSRIKCYNKFPEEFKKEKFLKITSPRKIKFVELNDLSKRI